MHRPSDNVRTCCDMTGVLYNHPLYCVVCLSNIQIIGKVPPPGVGVAYSVLPRILRMSSGLQDWGERKGNVCCGTKTINKVCGEIKRHISPWA